jgi:hypothetical protein
MRAIMVAKFCKERPQLARCSRNLAAQKVGSCLVYSGRGANPFEEAARAPQATSLRVRNRTSVSNIVLLAWCVQLHQA